MNKREQYEAAEKDWDAACAECDRILAWMRFAEGDALAVLDAELKAAQAVRREAGDRMATTTKAICKGV